MSTPSSKILLIGVDQHGIAQHQELLAQCQCVFATKRFMPLLQDFRGEILAIAPLSEALANISSQLKGGTVGVLASGDPLFFGIGKKLIRTFGKDILEIHPAISSMQLAFSRFKEPWQECQFISLHGRDLNNLPALMEGQSTIFFLTDATNSPDKIAALLLESETEMGRIDANDCYTVFVGEHLGMPNERLHTGDLREISAGTYDDLNVMIIKQHLQKQTTPALGLTESEIDHSRGLITKDEVRAVTIHRLRLPQHGVFWDIGAGSGSISIEAARMLPNLRIYSMERNEAELTHIRNNRTKHRAVNLKIIPGNAPKSLINLPAPDRIFIGGSGGMLSEIIGHATSLLPIDGRIVINAVTEKTRQQAPLLLHQAGLAVDISEIRVERSTYPEEHRKKITFNPISIITGKRISGVHESQYYSP